MTENEAEVLGGLSSCERAWPQDRDAGWRPQDFGAASNTHHSNTAKRAVDKGWVERKFLGGSWAGEDVRPSPRGARGSCRYRITEKGRKALANHNALRHAAKGRAT